MQIDMEAFRKRLARFAVSDLAVYAKVNRTTVRRICRDVVSPTVNVYNRLDKAMATLRNRRAAKA